jgi:hypothetical protein
LSETKDTVEIQWQSGYNGGLPQHFEIVCIRGVDGGKILEDNNIADPGYNKQTTYMIGQLQLGTEYNITVKAVNNFNGRSAIEQTIIARTTGKI